MKSKLVILITFLFISLNAYAQDLSSISFYGFQLNFSQEQVEQQLVKLGFQYEIKVDSYGLITLAPPDQVLSEQMNLNFQIGIYKNKIMLLSFYKRDSTLFESLKYSLNIVPVESLSANGTPIIEWSFSPYKIKCWNYKNESNITYTISNTSIQDTYKEDIQSSMGDDPFF